ncbi:BTAD domain-containing putative transcriptional regulator [Actinomadura pelletieri]|uniref:BTAD domain-containing putative transcriptional regulator n=1 Tax=Actinomadura pelletieri TaxID=111805 RepID=UPI000EAC18D5|nr:BTAD domain-containing putative transcriptional regulator [Actinomadura pelletieri]
MRFGVLGPLAVWTDDGTPVHVPERKVRTLLAILLTDPGRPVSIDRLVDALWGDRPPRNPSGTLQARVSQLRRVLDDAEPGARALLVARPPGYLLDVAPMAVDSHRFATLVAQAREVTDPLTKARLLDDALRLWRGPAFDDIDLPLHHAQVAALEERRLTALEEHAEARLDLGEHAALGAELAAAVARHPLRERLRAVHLRALYRAGRQGEALAGYHDLRERLAEELGVEPSPELAALYQSILEQDPAESGRRRVPSRLPTVLGELIGRSGAVERARAHLASDRLVTLTGPGGVGKTRLALETATRSVGDHPDGVWMVELAAVRAGTAEAVAEPVARALDLWEEGGSGPVERLVRALRARRSLLVLDNCEHVVEPAAELAGRLLADAPGLRILATSREPLGVPGERLQIVPPLDLPGRASTPEALLESGAVRLFVTRAAEAAPGFALNEESAPWVASICRRLDGLPLALELAATRVRALGVRELAARLDDRFRVLADGRHGGPARQRTLRAMIDWSWGLLTLQERVALRRLVVHAGGCTLDAAETVCDADAAVLARLVDRSLVVRDGDGRYRLLESVAAYGLERLRDAGEEDEFRRRHARYYLDLAERSVAGLRGPEQAAWLDRLDRETGNLAAATAHGDAVRLGNALAWYRFLRGRFGEARTALRRALDQDGPPSPARVEAAAWLAGFTLLSGERVNSEPIRQAALDQYKDDSVARAKAEWFLSHAHWAYGDLAANEERVDRALAVFRAAGDRWFTAAALATRAKFLLGRGDLAAAESDARTSLTIFDEIGDPWGRLEASDALVRHAEIIGEHDRAVRLLDADLRTAEALRLWPEVSYRLSALGRLALLTGDPDRAWDLHERAFDLAGRHAVRSAQEFAEIGLGIVARARGDLDTAEKHLRAWLGWLRGIGGTAGIAFALAQLGFIAEERGDAETALALHTEGLDAARKIDDPRAVALALEGLAGARSLAGDHPAAAGLLAEAATLREATGAPLPAAERRDVDRIAGRIREASGVTTVDSAVNGGRKR